ncbi:hypothetical protein BJV82DRAFT_671973 [Fennellomyces sp. T-0311]|nr:hypothetical protein BJV82DRAFT_671973 [Fennellomyces sp. T-0311]
MSAVNAIALLEFEESRCLERRDCVSLEDNLESLKIEDQVAITDPALFAQDGDLFKLIQRLDRHLYWLVRKGDYDKALEKAQEIQECAPESYYGYQRVAQIHLIRNKYRKAFRTYVHGYQRVTYGIELLRRSVEDTQHIFDQAAVELGNDRQFGRANGIAGWMITLLPASPTGYSRAANLYEMQGMTKAALKVYEKGISSVSIDNRDLFAKCILRLQHEIDCMPQCDFITQMPPEITSRIAQFLGIYDLIECLKVSMDWKERIRQCPEAWRVLNVGKYKKNIKLTAIQHVMRFVRQVTIHTTSSNQSLVEDLLISIGNGAFESLTHLGFSSATAHAKYVPFLTKIFADINLTCLDLTFSVTKPNAYILFHQVLKLCSHLKQLTYHIGCISMEIDYDHLPKVPTTITHLSVGGYPYDDLQGKVEKPHFFIPLIPLFPHLVDLCITDSCPGDLQTISKQCSNLRRLVVMKQPFESFRDFPDAASGTKGLQYLKIDGYVDPADVAGVISQNSETLISVDVTLDYKTEWDGQLVDPNWNYKNIPKLNCRLLKKLHFLTFYYWPFEHWIGNCPVLEEIKLEGVTDMTDLVFGALKRLPNLRSLDFEDGRKLTDAGLSGFFNDLQKQGSQLHTVTIRFCELLGAESLLSLVALQSLRKLSIYSCTGVTETVFQEFTAKVDSFNNIDTLALRSLDGVTDQALLRLVHALPQLQHLKLSYLGKITDSSLNAIADISSRTSLSKLNIYCCSGITSGAVNSARKLLSISLADF